jgi:hypothetical protein
MEGEDKVIAALSAHEKREQQRKAKEEARTEKEEEKELKQRKKNYFWMAVTIIVLIAFAGVVGWLYTHKKEMYTDREVHWHAAVDLTICGEHVDLPCNVVSEGTVHGKNFCGEHLLHHHYDNVIHIEGQIEKKEDIALGKFFDIVGIPFDKDKILDKKNGDLCDGKPGVLKMYVNNQPRTDFRDFIPAAVEDARKQVIRLVFEPEEGMKPSEEKDEAGLETEKVTEEETQEVAANST